MLSNTLDKRVSCANQRVCIWPRPLGNGSGQRDHSLLSALTDTLVNVLTCFCTDVSFGLIEYTMYVIVTCVLYYIMDIRDV